jgi:hypothetical protein
MANFLTEQFRGQLIEREANLLDALMLSLDKLFTMTLAADADDGMKTNQKMIQAISVEVRSLHLFDQVGTGNKLDAAIMDLLCGVREKTKAAFAAAIEEGFRR